MLNLLLLVGADVVAFAATNVDDIFVLLGFLSAPASLPRYIIVGQYLGIGAIVGSSLALSLVSMVIPLAWVGFLGVLPIVIGVRIAVKNFRRRPRSSNVEAPERARANSGAILPVAIVTALNGADSVAAYTALFAVQNVVERGITVVVFLVMTGIWCWIAAEIVRHPVFGPPIRRWGRVLLPTVLIGLGVVVLIESGSLGLLTGGRN
jgi:cadmium resistance protein CadD (predicted permease)